ncbi:hypothetical protein HRED_01691 [Candidatus Haloredivivus sp. G17]|jgi:hypothetical protein|nr:hypothetical protein HRED_01691 [Candidatus Haloredivivus sp. G17]
MKAEISTRYLVLIAIGAVVALTVAGVANTMLEDTFINALETAME